MTKVALTGANGFLGWHTKLALLESRTTVASIPLGASFDLTNARASLEGAVRGIHIAGVNRGSDDEVKEGNISFAEQFALAISQVENPPPVVVYANSTQSGNGSVYGEAKSRAAQVLADAAAGVGAKFVEVLLPNLFGEHGKPFYNAVTATFCHLLTGGESPTVENDKELALLHAQDAADLLVGATEHVDPSQIAVRLTVSELLRQLTDVSRIYSYGEVPDISTSFARDLFNTYRSYTIDSLTPIHLTRHADRRGSFFEIIRSHGGSGQSSFSTTAPGITRGDHFHRRKVERFTVLSGTAVISMRKLFTDKVILFDVNGDAPVAVDMPTGWAHNITNVGSQPLYTSFWTNDIFDPMKPDTIAEVV